jgi:hypothetical protein
MSDDFEGIPLDLPAEVPAETQPDGAVTEDNTGEQVADEAGNASWYDSTYPGQTQNTPAPAVDESAAETARLAQQNQTATGTPIDVSSTTSGLPSLPITNVTDQLLKKATDAVSSVAANLPKTLLTTVTRSVGTPSTLNSVIAGLPQVINSFKGATTNSPSVPTQDAYGLSILDATQTAQLTRNINPAFINSLVDPNSPQAQSSTGAVNTSAAPVNTGAGAAAAAANQQTAAAAARLNAESPNPYLTNIDTAAAEISRGQEGIATATQTIQSAQQKISDSESYIAQNNAELANPDISAARRAELEANNAAQTQNIFDQTQSITENQAYIATTTETIQFNEATIDTNSAGYRATTAGSNVPVVEVNSDPSFVGPQQITATAVNPTASATAVDPKTLEGYGVNEVGATAAVVNPTTTAAPVNVNTAGLANVVATTAGATTANTTAAEAAAIQAQVGRALAQQQAVLAAQKKTVNNGDWRVRLSLAPGANYLYNDAGNGILYPLALTSGVIFPYMPQIETSYKADYDSYALTHSNYKGYFYKSSYTDAVNMTAVFTAQDTAEANYLLAVIHFFRSVTKMFYGQDAQRGAPPPLVYLTGLGEYQFAAHPCVVTSFNYNLPADVDYIRTRSTNINGANMLTRRDRQTTATDPISGAVGRLQNLFNSQGISKGAETCRPPPPTLGQNQPTYVPTRMQMTISLLPIQSRQQVSREFSLQQYARGDLLKGGFW